jgi:hypothetical protein
VSEAILKKLPDSVTISETVLTTPIGESLMLLELTEGAYYELEEVGARMWQLLAEHKTPAEVAHQISVEYQISEPSVSADLSELLNELSASGLVSFAGEPAGSPSDESVDE